MGKKIRTAAYVGLLCILILSCAQKEDIKETFNSSTSENEAEFSVSEETAKEDSVSEEMQKEGFVSEEMPNESFVSEEPPKEEAEKNTIGESQFGVDIFITGNSYEEEYKNSIEWLQNRIQTREPEIDDEYRKHVRQRRVDNLTDNLETYMEFVDSLCGNENMDSGEREKTYQKAMAFLLAACKMHRGYEYNDDSMPNDWVYTNNYIGDYIFAYGQESMDGMIGKIMDMQFKEYPIDTGFYRLKELLKAYPDNFGYKPDLMELEHCALSWEKEFYHCIQVTEQYMSDNHRTSEAENLRAFEGYVSEWADEGEEYVSIESGTGLSHFMYAARKEAFRTGTVALLMFCEQEGITYEYLYGYEEPEKRIQEAIDAYKKAHQKQ